MCTCGLGVSRVVILVELISQRSFILDVFVGKGYFIRSCPKDSVLLEGSQKRLAYRTHELGLDIVAATRPPEQCFMRMSEPNRVPNGTQTVRC